MPYLTNYTLSPESLARVQAYKDNHATLYNIQEVAAITGKAIPSLRRYIKTGELECCKIHGRLCFTEEQIEAFMRPTQKGEE